jgi:hypothetical protein
MNALLRYLRKAFGPEYLSQWVTVGVAVGALIFAWKQIESARDVAYEAYALSAFQKYNEYRVQYPKLATGEPDGEDVGRYAPFLVILAFAGEAVLIAYPDSPEWRRAVEDHLSVHCAVLKEVFSDNDLLTYDRLFQDAFRRVINSCTPRLPSD